MPTQDHTHQTRYLYEEVRDEILSRIESGLYAVGARLPGTRSLVDDFSTTPVTINRALSDLVNSGHIRRVAKSGSFVNDRELWNGAANQRTGLVGIIAFDMQISVYWTQVVEAMQAALESRSMHAVIGYSEHNFSKAHAYVDDLVDKGIDGLIYVPIDAVDEATYERENGSVCEHIARRGVPFVLFDRRLQDNRYPSVTADVYAAGRELMKRLAATGVKKPLCLTVEHSQAIAERERAFLYVGAELGLDCTPDRIIRFPLPRVYEHQIPEFQSLIEAAPDFDSLFVTNSNLYASLLKVEVTCGRSIGVPIVTYRDLETESPERPVARAIQPVREFGSVAGQLLARLIEGDHAGADVGGYPHIVLPVAIEARD